MFSACDHENLGRLRQAQIYVATEEDYMIYQTEMKKRRQEQLLRHVLAATLAASAPAEPADIADRLSEAPPTPISPAASYMHDVAAVPPEAAPGPAGGRLVPAVAALVPAGAADGVSAGAGGRHVSAVAALVPAEAAGVPAGAGDGAVPWYQHGGVLFAMLMSLACCVALAVVISLGFSQG